MGWSCCFERGKSEKEKENSLQKITSSGTKQHAALSLAGSHEWKWNPENNNKHEKLRKFPIERQLKFSTFFSRQWKTYTNLKKQYENSPKWQNANVITLIKDFIAANWTLFWQWERENLCSAVLNAENARIHVHHRMSGWRWWLGSAAVDIWWIFHYFS